MSKSSIPVATQTQESVNQVWDAPIFASNAMREVQSPSTQNYRLFKVTEIAEGKAAAYRLAMANVMAGMDDPRCRAIYILSGTPEGVSLYAGIASSQVSDDDLHNMTKTLKASFEGNFLGAQLDDVKSGDAQLAEMLDSVKHLGLVTGVPSFNEEESHTGDEDFQGIERLANSMAGETWQLIVVAEPGTDHEVRDTLQRIYEFSTEISQHQKQSVQQSENTGWSTSTAHGASTSDTHGTNTSETLGKNEGASKSTGKSHGTSSGTESSRNQGTNSNESTNVGTSTSNTAGSSDSRTTGNSDTQTKGESGGKSLAYTTERTNKHVEEVQKHISENLIPRFQQGRSKGMFRTAIYVSAPEKATYERLTRSVLSIFQGNESTMTPLRADKLSEQPIAFPLRIREFSKSQRKDMRHDCELAHSIPYDPETSHVWGATWLTTRELSLLAGLPTKELPGIRIRKSVDFALNTNGDQLASDDVIELGCLLQHGRKLPYKKLRLSKIDLNKHVFVTGVTGAGKTTTCMKLLLESGLPFMVIEPAKTEYRALHGVCENIESYVLGREDITPFRLNPFELVSPHENLAGHIDNLKATLTAVFPMEASMPYIVAEAIINAYKAKGWDIHSGSNFLYDDPWAHGSHAWPIFSDMIAELDGVIKAADMGQEFQEKYRGSLVSRLTDLTLGTKGRMLNTRYSLDFDQLLDKKVVIELEELKDEQDKALFMGFILQRLAECMKQRHRKDKNFKHLTLVEEAHRLLSRPEPGESDSKKQGVETFANLLAEVRKYGEGLIIADQIPNKLISDVIKNTHTKIVHRLFAADDRNTIGDAMGLTDDQKDFLPLLQPGETVMFCGGWHAAVRVKVDELVNTTRDEITEEDMKNKGLNLMWEQRLRLYPRLAAREEMSSAAVLGRFVEKGIPLLNMFLRMNYIIGDAKQASKMAERIRTHYAESLQDLLNFTGFELEQTAQLLTDLFFDVSGFIKSEDTDAMTERMLHKALPIMEQGIEAFLELRKCGEGRSIFKAEFLNLRKLESI